MPIPDQDIVQRILATDGRDARIRACLEKAWSGVKNKYADRAWWRRKSTTRAVMWEESVRAVIGELDTDDGIKVIGHHDTTSFVADDTVLFRLKKAAPTLFTSNYPTLLADFFHMHQTDLFGHEGHHRVEIVHVFNRFQTELDWIGVVARDKNRVIWQFELPIGGAVVAEMPISTPSDPGKAADTVLRPAVLPDERKSDEADR